MQVIWSDEARRDLGRLHAFLAPKSLRAADRAISRLVEAPEPLRDLPRLGSPMRDIDGEVRRLLVGPYELRYEITGDVVLILRIFHMREDR